jgi:MFS family permease
MGRFNVAILTNVFAVIVIFAVWFPAEIQSDKPTLVFAVLYGFPLGCFSAILPALIGQISDVREIGVRYGATFFLTAWAGLTGNPIAGALLTRGQKDLGDGGAQFNYLKIFSGLTIAVGMGFLILARHVQEDWNTDKRRIKIV